MDNFKKVQVLALPYNGKITDKPFSTKLIKNNLGKWQWGNPVGQSEQAYHLYLLSDDKIEVGDVYYSGDRTSEYGIHICDSERLADICNQNNVKKVIASTDEKIIFSTNILKIGTYFVGTFISKNENITKVWVEELKNSKLIYKTHYGDENCIVIYFYINKAIYKREEVIALIVKMQEEGIMTPKIEIDKFNKWIEDNV